VDVLAFQESVLSALVAAKSCRRSAVTPGPKHPADLRALIVLSGGGPSYARQADDTVLETMATRIQARAIRRCGELLQQIEPGQGARDGKRQEGDHPPLNRSTAATDAGLSEHQRKTALCVANVRRDSGQDD